MAAAKKQAKKAAPAAAPVASAAPMAKDDANLKSALCYFPFFNIGFIVSLVLFLVEKENRTIRFNALQSLALMIAVVFGSIALAAIVFVVFLIIVIVLTAIAPGVGLMLGAIGWFILVPLFVLLVLGLLALDLYLCWKAYLGEKIVLPVIGPFADKHT